MDSISRKCLRCHEEMTLVWVNTGGGTLILEEAKKGFFNKKTSAVNGYVCTNCGHVELVATQPEVFN